MWHIKVKALRINVANRTQMALMAQPQYLAFLTVIHAYPAKSFLSGT